MVRASDIEGIWYHGDLEDADFSTRSMDTEDYTRSPNALGPGIYWTRDRDQARGYAGKKGYVFSATMDLTPRKTMSKDDTVTSEIVERFISLAPRGSRRTGLENWDNNIDQAVSTYVESGEDLLDALVGVYHDFYGMDSRAFGRSMVRIGYDAYIHHLPNVDHLVVWNPKIIKVKEVDKAEEHVFEHLINFRDFLDK